ncbi:MAG: hypothetical protein ABIW16_04160 [Sphingomicrobium sp.]
MNRLAMSRAAAGLLHALLKRAGPLSNRVLLTDLRSTDWHSLTLEGERHVIVLRIPVPDPQALLDRLTSGIEVAEFTIPGQIVADIALAGAPVTAPDGSLSVTIEALTVVE